MDDGYQDTRVKLELCDTFTTEMWGMYLGMKLYMETGFPQSSSGKRLKNVG